jgi:hypothetical protein
VKHLPLVLAGAVLIILVGWNGQRFRNHEQVIRAKDLSFLPSPEVARVLAFGHANSLARLRWIDAFAYFEFQLDRKDDTVAGGGRGFERLYDTLIALDPHFAPFYQHAALAVGGILGRHDRELGYLMRGLMELPHETSLWRHAASVLYVTYQWDERQPLLMDAYLDSWAAAEDDPMQKRAVWEWKAGMARRRFHGLEQIPYWLDRLAETPPGTPMGDYIEATIREQVAVYGVAELNAVLADRRAAGLPVARVEDLLDPERLNARHLDGRFGPVQADAAGRPVLRDDPYGYPYALRDGVVVSPGHELYRFQRRIMGCNIKLRGAVFADVAAIRASGFVLPEVPAGVAIEWRDGALVTTLPTPPAKPMPLR